jgi:hypothetical protein
MSSRQIVKSSTALVPVTKASKSIAGTARRALNGNPVTSVVASAPMRNIGPLQPRYADPEQMKECSVRLLKARSDPFGNFKFAPCNTSSTASNTIRFKTFYRVGGFIGTAGWGFAALNTKLAATSDLFSCTVSGSAYAATGVDVAAVGTFSNLMQGSFFKATDYTDETVKVRRVAAGIRLLPVANAITAQGFFQPWSAPGDRNQVVVDANTFQGNTLTPITQYGSDKKYLAVWTPSSTDDENWIPISEMNNDIGTKGADMAIAWITGRPGDPFLVEFVAHFEAESFVLYTTLALPSEHDPAGASAVNTAMTRIVRTNLSIPSNSENGFFDKAWNWIKDEGANLVGTFLPDLASKAGRFLLSLI